MELIDLETANLSSSLSAQISFQCVEKGTPVRHRAFIYRDGTVDTPDHKDPSDDIVQALGGKLQHTCAYWHDTANGLTGDEIEDPVDIASWKFDTANNLWTSKASWLVLSAILGKRIYQEVTPETTLAYAQVYVKKGLPADLLVNHIMRLENPAQRSQGFRRRLAPITPEELDETLRTGLPPHLASNVLALGYAPKQVQVALSNSHRLGLSPEILVTLGERLPINAALIVLQRLRINDAKELPLRLSTLVSLEISSKGLTVDGSIRFLLSGLPVR